MGEVILEDGGGTGLYSELLFLLAESGEGQGDVNLRKLLNNGLQLFSTRTVCLSADGATKYAGFLEPSKSLHSLLAAIRAGDRDLNLFVQDFLRHNETPTERASVAARSV